MAEIPPYPLGRTLTEANARSYITNIHDKLHNTSFKYGSVTTIKKGPNDAPERTTLKIQEEDGDEYNFKGSKAHYGISREKGCWLEYLCVYFFAKEDTEEVLGLFLETISGWELLRPDEDFCKLRFKQHSTRLMLVIELKSVRFGDRGMMDALTMCVHLSCLTLDR